ncbi:hypothetical protein F5Y07DRAFT_353285 [Xylaria sp. FL0933]|nr:hypothetical protein F5Y07DRAFT_353285 [Xylaria sp. FL0933]
MYHGQRIRYIVGLAIFVLLVVISLTYGRSFGAKNLSINGLFPVSRPTPPASEAAVCRAKQNDYAGAHDELLSEECDNDIHLPYVGDVNVFGGSGRCYRAGVRLERYRLASGRNGSDLNWGRMQSQCASASYVPLSREQQMQHIWRQPPDQDERNTTESSEPDTAIVLRTWDDYEYTDNRLAWLRAVISEASFQRKHRYRVFFLVNIKNPELYLQGDTDDYERLLRNCVPEEFRHMAFLFNEKTLKAWYPLVSEHRAQDQMYQALQIFSHKFPEYEFLWQLEMDLRFTSHIHDMLEASATFARKQKRRNLWERNGRFYNPALYNYSYEDFASAVDDQIGEAGIWGPVPTLDFLPYGPQASIKNPDWGIEEEADLISFMPMVDPVGTKWVYENVVEGFADGVKTPRRLAIISITRSSRRLLRLVSDAQRQYGRWLVSEATLETFSLLHGLKAVTVPHPIVFNRNITATELDTAIHRGPLNNRAGGDHPSMLYTMDGWIDGPWWDASYWFTGVSAQAFWDMYLGGVSLPPMLLHPVKEK